MRRSLSVPAAGLLAGLWLAPAASAQLAYYSVIDGSQDGTPSTATGTGLYVIDTAANTLDYTITFSGLTSAETAAHFHGPAPPGTPAGIAFPLGTGSPKVGTWNYEEGREADILAGLYYVNIHTMMFSGGEIRGQVVPVPIEYCFCPPGVDPCGNPDPGAGCANSTGSGASIAVSGMPSVILDTLTLTASPLPPGQFGIYFMGPNQIDLPFGDGRRCVGGQVFRYAPINSGPGGTITIGPGIAALAMSRFPVAGHIAAGQQWNFQCWYRDPSGPCGFAFNTSTGIGVAFTP